MHYARFSRGQSHMGACLPQSRDSIKVRELHNFATPAKGAFVAFELGATLAEPPEALKPKEGRVRRLFRIGLWVVLGLAFWNFPEICTLCSPSLSTSLGRASAREC